MTSFVSIDIETTGLDADRDTVIEIGAVRFNERRVEDEWTTLVNPGRHIPEFITGLTGIEDAMVRQAPKLREVAQELDAFAGDATVIGHNIRFDLGFLQKVGILRYNDVVDTYELAAVLLPSAPRYNLGSLGAQLGVPLPATHRALDDAKVTQVVFVRLLELAQELPIDLLAEFVRLSEPLTWDARWAFQQVLAARVKGQKQAKGEERSGLEFPFFPVERKRDKHPPLEQVDMDSVVPLNTEEVASILEYGGPFSQYFEAFEQRPEQVEMLRTVTGALSNSRHMMVEAGTGVGKCLTGNSWVTFKSGERRQIGEIVEAGTLPAEPILSIDSNGKLSYQKIRAVYNNGVQPIWRLRTGLGRKITATANHPLLTFNRWKHLSDLKVGDRIATLRCLPAGNQPYPDHEAFVAGAMLGDGGCGHPNSLTFTNFDAEVVETFRQNVEKLGNVQLTQHKAKGHYGFRRLRLMGHERSGLNLLLEKLDILGQSANTKTIPAAYFLADQKAICCLLAGLWVTDGCIERGRGNITFSSASEQLVSDIQHLLLRLGIISRIRYKPALLNEKRFELCGICQFWRYKVNVCFGRLLVSIWLENENNVSIPGMKRIKAAGTIPMTICFRLMPGII